MASIASLASSLVADLHEQPVLPHVVGQRHEAPELASIVDELAVGSQQISTAQVGYLLERLVDLFRGSSSCLAAGFVFSLRERKRRMHGWLMLISEMMILHEQIVAVLRYK